MMRIQQPLQFCLDSFSPTSPSVFLFFFAKKFFPDCSIHSILLIWIILHFPYAVEAEGVQECGLAYHRAASLVMHRICGGCVLERE